MINRNRHHHKPVKVIIEIGVQEDEPPPVYNLPSGWIARVVSCLKKNLSLCQTGTSEIGHHCIYRKFAGISGFAEFYS